MPRRDERISESPPERPGAERSPFHFVQSGWRGLAFGGWWLVFLIGPALAGFDRQHGLLPRVGIVLVLLAFCTVYSVVFLLDWRRERRGISLLALAILCCLVAALCLLVGQAGLFAMVFVAAAAVSVSPWPQAFLVGAGALAITWVVPQIVPGWQTDHGTMFGVGMACLATFAFVQLIRRNQELLAAQREIARLAVTEERERFSRDLHDILGHSLTGITVKAELAGRLMTSNASADGPSDASAAAERARAEVRDIERLARDALADVRATAAGYREVGLATELAEARQTLTSAGIEADLPNSVDEVSGGRRGLFGWVVREGVTNVVRHSRARRCRIALTETSIEVADDGVGTKDGTGNGLAGLRDRVAEAGGTLSAGPSPEGGFRLYVEVPR